MQSFGKERRKNVIKDTEGNKNEFLCTEMSIYDDPSKFMVPWWGNILISIIMI